MIKLFLLITLSLSIPKTSFAQKEKLFFDEPKILKKMELDGYHFAKWFSSSDNSIDNYELYKSSKGYRDIVNSISTDLTSIAQKDPLTSVTMARSHRLFNKKWLKSKAARYELVGVINRIDRKDFHPNTCGELRFIYRLSYNIIKKKHSIRSRLPLTFNVVTFLPHGDCSKIAKDWEKLNTIGDQKLKSIELNMQAVRWPSTVRPDFGGYAEYLLRVFKPISTGFKLDTLENTPDLDLLKKNKPLREELLRWITQTDNLKNLDNGILVIPKKFLATKATSVALNGRARKFNQPFSRIFSESDFKNLNLSNFKSFNTPYALLKRVNDMSCIGCHQGRTIAGFHFLGKDRKETSPVNSIMSSFSAHFFNDQKRRKTYIQALINKKIPESFRSMSVRAPHEKGDLGSHCSMGVDSSYKNWTCESGLKCARYDLDRNSPLGICVEPSNLSEGSPCKIGYYKQNDNPHKDRIIGKKELSCREDLICEDNSVGFPGGMCSGNCSKLGKDATCGSIAVLFGFNQCLAKGKAFDDCLMNNVRPGSLRACSSIKQCRDDYICAKTKSGSGGCIPPYFLFQLRVDGHPKPI